MIDLGLANHDLVLLDTPPLLDSADAAMIIQMPAAAMLVVRAEHDVIADVSAAGRELEKLNASAVGAIMTREIAGTNVPDFGNDAPGLNQAFPPQPTPGRVGSGAIPVEA